MFQIIATPNPILTSPSKPVTKFDKKLHEVIVQMKKTLDATRDPVGVGLAAPQVGLSLQLFLVKPKINVKTLVFINPVIIAQKDAKSDAKPRSVVQRSSARASRKRLLEGCLSIPNIWGHVERNREITVRYKNEHGKEKVKTFRGFLASIIQHETDHLNGVLFTKHVIAQGEKLYKSHKNEKGEDEFEEIKI